MYRVDSITFIVVPVEVSHTRSKLVLTGAIAAKSTPIPGLLSKFWHKTASPVSPLDRNVLAFGQEI